MTGPAFKYEKPKGTGKPRNPEHIPGVCKHIEGTVRLMEEQGMFRLARTADNKVEVETKKKATRKARRAAKKAGAQEAVAMAEKVETKKNPAATKERLAQIKAVAKRRAKKAVEGGTKFLTQAMMAMMNPEDREAVELKLTDSQMAMLINNGQVAMPA